MPLNERVDRPLVTISMSTYNQEKYVRDSVRGLLSQTYEPLEIIISDDCSQDRTWEIINEEVRAYKETGGRHTRIVLNRNERNLGISRHSGKVLLMCHGVLRVGNGGDDISAPNRVERIFEEWDRTGRTAANIYSGAWLIDYEGHRVGQLGRYYFTDGCLGAVAAYSMRIRDEFKPIVVAGGAEDTIYANRARLLGTKKLYINENLLSYRVGTGVSTVGANWRKPNLSTFRANVKSAEQALLDLETVRARLEQTEYAKFKDEFEATIVKNQLHAALLSASSFRERWNAYRRIHYRPWFRPGGIYQLLCLLPPRCGDPMLNLLSRLNKMINQKMGSRMFERV